MSSRELTEWMCYYEQEPWGEERADLRAGIIASTIANANRAPKKRKKPFTPTDFMPKMDRATRPAQDAAEPDANRLLHVVEQWNAALGGKDLRPNRKAQTRNQ